MPIALTSGTRVDKVYGPGVLLPGSGDDGMSGGMVRIRANGERRGVAMMTKFKSVQRLAEAIANGEVPTQLLSPGGAAVVLGITRQAVHQRIRRGTLRAYGTDDGIVLIHIGDVQAAKKAKRLTEKLARLRERFGVNAGAGTM